MKTALLIDVLRKYRRRVRGVLRWTSKTGRIIAGREGSGKRRLLVVYDLSTQPFSVGDLLIYQEASLVLKERTGFQVIDFAVVYDPRQPVVRDPAFREIDSQSFLFHLSSVLPAAQVNAHLGSLFLFDSHRQLESFIASSSEQYEVWPDLGLYSSGEYLFYYCFNELFFDHYRTHGSLPSLRSRPAARAWAHQFLAAHAGDQVPITIQLRRNPVNPERNSKYEHWIAMFEHCAERYPATFFVICAYSEIDPRLRDVPNVVVVKDYCTGLEQDLALIEAASFHMGACSGPGTIAQFNTKPYCNFGWKINLSLLKHVSREEHRYRFYFSNPLQNWIMEQETSELLRSEFEHLWLGLGNRGVQADYAAEPSRL